MKLSIPEKKSALSIRIEKINFFFSFQLDALYPAGSTLTAELASGVDPVEAMRKAVEVCVLPLENALAPCARCLI